MSLGRAAQHPNAVTRVSDPIGRSYPTFGVTRSRVRRRITGVLVCAVLVLGGMLGIASGCSTDGGPAPGPSAAATAPQGAHQTGSLIAADTLWNTRIGGPNGTVLAFRFRARWTGPVRGVRFFVILNPPGRQGYSGGNNGLLRVALARDSRGRRHIPAARSLAAAVIRPSSDDLWPLVRFEKRPYVVAGRLYHVVFTNVASNPRRNYPSINGFVSRGHGEPTPPVPSGLAALLGDSNDGGATPSRWRPRAPREGDRFVPILDVVGARPDEHLGVGYMESWETAPKPIGGRAGVRQLFQPAGGRRAEATGAWLRVVRNDGATAPLELRLETPDGRALTAASVPAGDISSRSPQWVHVRFARPVPLPPDTTLALAARAGRDLSYQAFPLRKGTSFGFDPRTVFSGGYAQFSPDGEDWRGWDQWGERDRRDGDLQFALDVRPSSGGSGSS
jgi:hypothetical protein